MIDIDKVRQHIKEKKQISGAIVWKLLGELEAGRRENELVQTIAPISIKIIDLSEPTCEWTRDEDGGNIRVGECDKHWQFYKCGPIQNGMIYCPYCGRRIVEA